MMDSFEQNQNRDYIDDRSAEQLLPLESSDMTGVLGEPEIPPRIGDQYQVEIPPLRGGCISYTKSLADEENRDDISWDFIVGLPVPIMLVNQSVGVLKYEKSKDLGDSRNESTETESSHLASTIVSNTHSEIDSFKAQINPSDITLDDRIAIRESAKLSFEEKLQEVRSSGYCFVPGIVLDSWSDTEKEIFLLGVYIFEKNFVHLKRFIETKRIGDILSYYYGKFYGSNEYRRWSECRKVRNRRSVYGQKMFTGSRQQELLSRLLPSISKECQNSLQEVTKAFGEGKILLEDYVFSLKAMVGANLFIEAVGIGKGKLDLTCMALEHSRSNNAISMRTEVPAGKACSTLTPGEIITFLTGDYRLSKARSNDLFWEAVWPLLLARDWHSEQPKGLAYAANSKSLVFLMPGITKFSRKLVKGNHYFDSVTDVLAKVASDPSLIELDVEDGGNKNREDGDWIDEAKLEQDQPIRQRTCYLQPRTPIRYTDVMKFTVVDTSISDGKPYKVRELRSLPMEISNILSSRNDAEDSEELSTDESDTIDTSVRNEADTNHGNFASIFSNGEMHSDGRGFEIGASRQKIEEVSNEEVHMICPASTTVPVNNSKNFNYLCEGKQPKGGKARLNQRSKVSNVDYIAPTAKRRRRLTACSRAEIHSDIANAFVIPRPEAQMTSHNSSINGLSMNNFQIGSSQDKLSSSSSSKSSPSQSIECASDNIHVLELPNEEPRTRTMIDLNEPQIHPDSENGVLIPELMEEKSGKMKKPDAYGELKTLTGMVSLEPQQPSVKPQRHSTRNRPPTTKALEALANGFLTVNRRQKNSEASSRRKSVSRNSRQAQAPGGMLTDYSNSTLVSQMEEGDDAVSKEGESNNLGKFHHLPEDNRTTISGP